MGGWVGRWVLSCVRDLVCGVWGVWCGLCRCGVWCVASYVVSGVRCLLCVVCGLWCVVCGVLCVVCGVRCAVFGVYWVCCVDVRSVARGVWSVVCGV